MVQFTTHRPRAPQHASLLAYFGSYVSPLQGKLHTYTSAAERLRDSMASAIESTKPSRPGLSG